MSCLKDILKLADKVTTVEDAHAIRRICRVLVINGLMSKDARNFITRRMAQAVIYNSGITEYSMHAGGH